MSDSNRGRRPVRQWLADDGIAWALAANAFGGSFTHIVQLAHHYGVHGGLAYPTAGCVDAVVVMAARERQRDKREGHQLRGPVSWPFVVLVGGIALTLAANLARAQHTGWGWIMFGLPAGSLLLAVSMLERRAGLSARRAAEAQARNAGEGASSRPAGSREGVAVVASGAGATTANSGANTTANSGANSAATKTGAAGVGPATLGPAPARQVAGRRGGVGAAGGARPLAGVYPLALPARPVNGGTNAAPVIAGKRGAARELMRAHWDAEIAAGRIPSGAELNAAAGKDRRYSLGKKYAQEWRAELPALPALAGAGTAAGVAAP